MPVLAQRRVQAARGRILLATGFGAIFGLLGCKLAEYGFALSIPWRGQVWIWVSHVLLGLAIGASAGWTRWWKRAAVFGLAFGVPSSCGALSPELKWAPFGIAAATEGLAVALLIAFLADAIFPRKLESPDEHCPDLPRLPATTSMAMEERFSGAKRRLAEQNALLDQLDRERESRGDSNFGRATEDRIVWGELLDLELQDIDEQLNRIRHTAGKRL